MGKPKASSSSDDEESLTSKLKTLAEEKYKQSNPKSALKYAKRALRHSPKDPTISDMVTTFKILHLYSKSQTLQQWYQILELEPFSHINSIKKHYKKLALTLHPDKNTCIASAEAFNCVSQAWQVLSDKIRRKDYDLKLRIALQAQATTQRDRSPDPVPVPLAVVETFWTACSTCRLFHEYERRYVGCKLLCPSCRKSFIAQEVNVDDQFDDFEDIGVRGERRIDELGNGRVEKNRVRGRKPRNDEMASAGVVENFDNVGGGKRTKDERGRVVEDFDNGGSPRFNLRSLAKKGRNVGRGEMTLAEMQLEAKRKLLEERRKRKAKEEREKEKEKGRGKKRDESSMVVHLDESNEMEVIDVEDSDFYNFDKDRGEKCFKRSQVWAIYDDDDGMPRLYGLIDEVVSMNPFELKMSWLDVESNGDERLLCWERSGFHISCGRFKVSRKTSIDSVNIFSHVVECERVARAVYKIYPKKGSIWALYNEKALEVENGNPMLRDNRCYDIVVSLTTYSEMHGLSMAYLEKVEGFKTVFKRQEIGAHAVKWLDTNDFRLFSHQIPAKKLAGTEAPNIPGDCWELDPASLPPDLLTIEQ